MSDNEQNNKKLFWSHKMIELFIALYKENSCLYDTTQENYSNYAVKLHALKNISQRMQEFLPNLEMKDVQNKIKEIRRQLSEEMSLVDAAEVSGNKYVPKLWCFDQLEFLRKHITSSTMDKNSEDDNLIEEYIHNDAQSEDSDDSQYRDMEKPRTKRIYCKKFKWRRENLKYFIKILNRYKILYDPSHEDYLNRQSRCIAYRKLLKETRRVEPKINLDDIRDKMRCLRKQYTKEVRCILKAKENNETYKPTLWCFGWLLNLYHDEFGIRSYSKLIIDDTTEDNSFTTTHLSDATINNDNTNNNSLFEFEQIHQVVDENEMEFYEESVSLPNMTTMAENSKKTINNSQDVNYEWLGDLVVSQLGDVARKYHTDFVWDVQCLIRKYILKSKADNQIIASTPSAPSSDENNHHKTTVPNDIDSSRNSNVSFNISFLCAADGTLCVLPRSVYAVTVYAACKSEVLNFLTIIWTFIKQNECKMENEVKNNKQLIWNRKMIEMLIKLYQENECLYDMSHQNYNNQTVKTHALKNITQKMQQFLPNLKLMDVQDKIKVIRNQLSAEISLIDAAEATGNKYASSLWCLDQLEFLRKHIINSAVDSDSKEEHIFADDVQNYDDDSQNEDSDVSLYTERNKSKRKTVNSRKFKWQRQNVKVFIRLLERCKILFDPNHKDYVNQQLRYVAYSKLLKATRKLHPEVTLKDIRGKIRCLRNQYLKEMHGIKGAKERNEEYIPKLWCFDMLANLYKDISDKKSNSKRNNEDATNTSQLSEESINIDNASTTELFEFEEIDQVIVENEVDYDKESITMDITQNNENLQTTVDYECVNSFEFELEDLPPPKKTCHIKEYCDSETDFNETNKPATPQYRTKSENIKTPESLGDDAKYEWLGNLVVSQLGEISKKYHTEFAWDVQCLIRKYILKSKAGEDETTASSTSATTSTNMQGKTSIPHDIVLPRSSNVSFNLSFL
ncbi:uncharacterized protein LOC135951426 [Calliphora vicina]|uniref:uncharacterized protein LOC135951426 n=1 Tax=Calliphora vicina TaxID=7373 RepID=UPI00325BAD1B